jgi:hypothetical protein
LIPLGHSKKSLGNCFESNSVGPCPWWKKMSVVNSGEEINQLAVNEILIAREHQPK